jgi:DNA replication and repair protein RecF
VTERAVLRLVLRDFRNYRQAEIEWGPAVNLVVGRNAQGKTNVLEAVRLLSTGRLMRASEDSQAIRHDAETATVDGALTGGDTLRVTLSRTSRKTVTVNGSPLRRASDLIGRLPTVEFSAADLNLVKGGPQDRRDFMDSELAQFFPAYLRDLAVYKRALAQRNALLRSWVERRIDPALVEAWDLPLADAGARLRSTRRAWVCDLSDRAGEAHRRLARSEKLSLSYETNDAAHDAEELTKALKQSVDEDLRRGRTCVGPHLDDLSVLVDGRPLRHYGSQGQQRSAVVSIKLAVFDALTERLGHPPTLLLDDVFSDLDTTRRDDLVRSLVEQGGQTIITCTEESQVSAALLREANVLRVSSGQVSKP